MFNKIILQIIFCSSFHPDVTADVLSAGVREGGEPAMNFVIRKLQSLGRFDDKIDYLKALTSMRDQRLAKRCVKLH